MQTGECIMGKMGNADREWASRQANQTSTWVSTRHKTSRKTKSDRRLNAEHWTRLFAYVVSLLTQVDAFWIFSSTENNLHVHTSQLPPSARIARQQISWQMLNGGWTDLRLGTRNSSRRERAMSPLEISRPSFVFCSLPSRSALYVL